MRELLRYLGVWMLQNQSLKRQELFGVLQHMGWHVEPTMDVYEIGGREDYRDEASARKRIAKAARIFRDIAVVKGARIREVGEQPAKKRCIHSGCDRQEQIRRVRLAVRRGSITTNLAPRSFFAAIIR